MSEVPSSFPNIEDNYMFGYQHLLVSDNYPGVDGDHVDDEETETNETINEEDNNDQNEDCHQSGNGQNSAGNNVCIKRMGFDTEINPVTKKRQLSLYGRTEFNNASCGREIGNILQYNFKGPWHSWDKVDLMYKDELFKEFKKKYDFPKKGEDIVRNIWEVKVRISLNQLLARARFKALAKLNTTNITDCIDNGPIWIQKEDWNKMILEVWSTEEFHRRSDASKRNRLKQTDGKISSHCGGSVSFASYRASMQQQAGGKELPWDDVFSMLHQNVNQTGTFVDNRSKTVVEKYRNEMIAKYGPNRDVHPSFDGEAWCQASGGVNKDRVYGAPRMPASKVSTSSSQHSYSMNSTYPSTVIQELKDELLVKDVVIKNMQRQIDSITTYLANQYGSNMSTPVGTMPSHTMAHMGPTSCTTYRPRPHPPNTGPSASHQHRKSFPP